MPSLSEPASSLRVLLRIPDVSDTAASAPPPAVPAPVQKPVEPPSAAKPKQQSPPAKELRGITPDELRPSRFSRPFTILVALALAAVVAVVVTGRFRKRPPEGLPQHVAEGMADSTVPGGSPAEITQIPEISFPEESSSPVAANAAEAPQPSMLIERLPAVEAAHGNETLQDGATAQISDSSPTSQKLAEQPGVARLDRQIEHPKPQASHDTARPGLY